MKTSKKTTQKAVKLLPRQHTGRYRHHRHTSYRSLAVMLVFALGMLVQVSRARVYASADPVTGTESIHAVVPAPTPTAPQITSVVSGAVYSNDSPLTASGTCSGTVIVKVFKNNILAGAAFCENGHFSVLIDLFLGANAVTARAYNANNVSGPESAVVSVTRNLASGNPATGVQQGDQFFITSDVLYKGTNVGDQLTLPLTISGGQAAYAVSVGWGDGKTDLVSRGQAGTFSISHTYKKAGKGAQSSYDIVIQGTDQNGNKSFLRIVTIVSGESPAVINSIKSGYNTSLFMKIGWQLLIVGVLVAGSFWLGERRESLILNKKYGKA